MIKRTLLQEKKNKTTICTSFVQVPLTIAGLRTLFQRVKHWETVLWGRHSAEENT